MRSTTRRTLPTSVARSRRRTDPGAARSRYDGVGRRARRIQRWQRPLHRRDSHARPQGGAIAEDGFGFDIANALFTVSGSNLKSGGATFATFTIADGVLTITFNSTETAATPALVNDVLAHITYTNTSDAPPASVVLDYSFNDGNPANGQGSGAAGSDTGTTTVNIAPVDDPATVSDDSLSTVENTPVTVDVLANDSDPDVAFRSRRSMARISMSAARSPSVTAP